MRFSIKILAQDRFSHRKFYFISFLNDRMIMMYINLKVVLPAFVLLFLSGCETTVQTVADSGPDCKALYTAAFHRCSTCGGVNSSNLIDGAGRSCQDEKDGHESMKECCDVQCTDWWPYDPAGCDPPGGLGRTSKWSEMSPLWIDARNLGDPGCNAIDLCCMQSCVFSADICSSICTR